MRLGFAGDCPCLIRVSIHASVKDATSCLSSHFLESCVSIHASVKDATRGLLRKEVFNVCFNPRICKRCDAFEILNHLLLNCFNPRICKRCDIAHGDFNAAAFSFNPRICKRCDVADRTQVYNSIEFQSTHL